MESTGHAALPQQRLDVCRAEKNPLFSPSFRPRQGRGKWQWAERWQRSGGRGTPGDRDLISNLS